MATDPDSNTPNQGNYDAESIKVLKGLDAVRKRPGMYIGDTDDGSGLHHMVFEVSDNAIDEALAGHCDRILIQLNPDGSVTVEDNGRGIPDRHPRRGRRLGGRGHHDPAPCRREVREHLGRQCLQGVGRPPRRRRLASSTRFSEWLELTIWRDGEEHFMRFRHGDAEAPLKIVGPAPEGKKGTRVTFLPSPETFKIIEFDFEQLEHRYPRARLPQLGRAPDPRRRAA